MVEDLPAALRLPQTLHPTLAAGHAARCHSGIEAHCRAGLDLDVNALDGGDDPRPGLEGTHHPIDIDSTAHGPVDPAVLAPPPESAPARRGKCCSWRYEP